MTAKDPTTSRAILLTTAMATVSLSVAPAANLTWDPSGGGTSDGAGSWLDPGKWWDGSANVDWSNATPDDAIIGNGGAGGTITVGAVTAGSVLLDNFTGKYTLSSGTLTQSGGFTLGPTADRVGMGSGMTLTGTGGVTVSGGIFQTNGATLSYTGTTLVNGSGTFMLFDNKPSGNFTLNNGLLADYYRKTTTFTGLGAGANQIQVYGQSGFGAGNGGSTWRIGADGSQLQWGSTFFNPTVLQFQTPADNMGPNIYGQARLDNGLDLNGAQRTVNVLGLGISPLRSSGEIEGKISDVSATTAGITKTGDGTLILDVPNDGDNTAYSGSFIINGGAVQFGTGFNNTFTGESLPSTANLDIQDGIAAGYFSFSRNLGSGAGEIQITGGTSGFTMKQGDRVDFTLDGGAELVWGSTFFAPDVLVLNHNDLAPSSPARLNNPIDLNGTDRTVFSSGVGAAPSNGATNGAFGSIIGKGGVLNGDIRNTQGTAAGLIKTGAGIIAMDGTNTYDGGTTVSEGGLYFPKLVAMPATGNVSVADGATLLVPLGGSGEWTTGTSGHGTLGGLFAGQGGQSPSTVSLSSAANLGLVINGTQTYSGVVASAGNTATYGTGTLVLDQNNTFTGDFNIEAGSSLQLTGDNSGASGNVNINNGYLLADLANLPGGVVNFGAGASTPAIWETSGSLTPTIGSADDIYWNAGGGFAATDSALTVTANGGTQIDWSANSGFRGQTLQLGSPTSTASVELTNDIDLDSNRNLFLLNNSSSNDDISILSGDIDGGGSNRNLTINGSGTLVLSGTNNFGTGTLFIGNGGANTVVRADEGVGLPTAAKLYFNNGVLETSGSFTRDIGTASGQVYWNNKGGFAANGGALTVNLEGGAALNWGDGNTGFRNQNPLYLGSDTADDVVTFQNDIGLYNNRNIQTTDNPDTKSDYAVISGAISNGSGSRNLTVQGNGKLVLEGNNSYTGTTTINGGTLIIDGDCTAATGLVDVRGSGRVLGGTGTLGGNVTLENNAGLTFDLSTAPGSHDKLDVLGSFTFESASVLTITSSGGATTGTYTLVSAGSAPTGSVPATVNLPVDWTADAPQIVGNDLVINITSVGSATTPYDDWADDFPGFVDTDPSDNPDGDSLVNLLEFGFGTDPTVSDAVSLNPDGSVNGLPIPVASGGGGGVTFDYVFVRREDHGTPGSVTYTPQFSSDLVTFHDSSAIPTKIADSTDDPAYDIVSVPYPATLPDGKKARFARLKVDAVE